LIDQPHFSNYGNVFLNSITASITLLLFPKEKRTPFWIAMLIFVLYLIISSYTLMWLRKSKLKNEPRIISFLSKINMELGKPTVLFSIFFIWGIIEKFGYNTVNANILYFFWSAFILLSIPSIAKEIEKLFIKTQPQDPTEAHLLSITNPLAAFIKMEYSVNASIGSGVSFFDKNNSKLAYGVLVDDRIIANDRIGKVKIKNLLLDESAFSDNSRYPIKAKIDNSEINDDSISVVDIGTSIGKVQFFINPSLNLEEGELVWVKLRNDEKAYFQVVYEEIIEEKIEEKNEIQYVKIVAGQLGYWQKEKSRFEQLKVVASAGEIINRVKTNSEEIAIPSGHLQIGLIPNSNFPIHIKLDDIVTHNTAILGVTGSGKSYLSFRIIEALIEQKIKVLILDPSRQHFSYLAKFIPTALRTTQDVDSWLNSTDSFIGIHQFGTKASMPQITADFVETAFDIILQNTKLIPGKNEQAKLCLVIEEAHSVIPEWNQVSAQADKDHVNRTARIILQGRKYGLGSIIITQRTANVTKTILNQCNTIFALQSFDQTGLDFLKNYMGEEYGNSISTLPLRHSILVGKASSSSRPVIFRVEDLKYESLDEESSEK
jgi:DNA helicase HerA-like ATPase